ncbi:MAG: 16S rRNA (cytidine(1402)-2'-O)-methyltransferase [Gemmatimonadota bacterium]
MTDSEPGTLFLVATPIGNLGDMSPRGLDALRGAATVFAEDTRRTLKLMRHFDLPAPLVALHAHNERERAADVVRELEAGKDCALVTDAGTPSVSDPGAALVRAVVESGHRVVPIPGPSAVLAALAASGFGGDQFAFLGFPPRKGAARSQWLARARDLDLTIVAFESPRRLGRLLEDLREAGLGEAAACVCRELTKLHEEVRRGTVTALADYYRDAEVRGEVTLVVDRRTPPPDEGAEAAREEAARTAAEDMAARGASTREMTDALRAEFGLTRNVAYSLALTAGRRGAEEGEPT